MRLTEVSGKAGNGVMDFTERHYTGETGFSADYHRVKHFLKKLYTPGYPYGNWLWNRWEWAFSLPNLNEKELSRMGVWEMDGEIVGLASYEEDIGEAWLSLTPGIPGLKRAMAEYAIHHMAKKDESGVTAVQVNVDGSDVEFMAILAELGYAPRNHSEYTAKYDIPSPFPEIVLPEGYSLVSLAEENDLFKINRMLWRGFNHEGEAPESLLPARSLAQAGPSFNKALTLAVKAPNGEFVSYCGMWYDPAEDYAMVEPVATDPDYRRLGLGKAVVLEGIRRCGELGAKVAYVGSRQDFYYAIGFKPHLENPWWRKVL